MSTRLVAVANRVQRYSTALWRLNGLTELQGPDVGHAEELVRRTSDFAGGYIAPIQIREELVQLVKDVARLKPLSVLELGTARGGTLFLWTRVAAPSAIVVSVDLPGGKFGGGYSWFRKPLYNRFRRGDQHLYLIRANSHDPATQERVRALFGHRPIDFLFIDGDHTYEGVKQDWGAYATLVRPGGLIAFHDIAKSYDDTQVQRFWNEIKNRFKHEEYVLDPHGLCGIGVISK